MSNFTTIVNIANQDGNFDAVVKVGNPEDIGNTVEVVNQAALPTPSLALQGLIHFAKAENTYHVINLAGNAFEIFGADAGGGSGIELNWTFNTSITEADPGISNFRLNNATPASVTELFVSTTSNSGADISAILSELKVGNTLYARQIDDATKNLVLNVVSIVDNTTWFKITVTVDDSTTLFGSGKEIAIIFMFSGMSAGDMTKAVYDPTGVNGDAFLMSNMVETAGDKILTSAERTKLSGIETLATADQTGAEIKTAYEAEANAFTDTKNTKLTGIETNATADQTGAEIKTAYEAEANAFTDTKNTKLTGIETNATADQTGAEIKTAYEAEANAYTDTKDTKLTGIETSATADQTNSEIETAYNLQVGAMSQATAEAGTSTTIERVTAERIKQAIKKLAPAEVVFAVSDETTALTTGATQFTFRMPFAMTLFAGNDGARMSLVTTPTGSAFTVDINESGSTILSTKLTIDANEDTSLTAASEVAISDTALAEDAKITIDIDTIGSTIAGAGLKIVLRGVRT